MRQPLTNPQKMAIDTYYRMAGVAGLLSATLEILRDTVPTSDRLDIIEIRDALDSLMSKSYEELSKEVGIDFSEIERG